MAGNHERFSLPFGPQQTPPIERDWRLVCLGGVALFVICFIVATAPFVFLWGISVAAHVQAEYSFASWLTMLAVGLDIAVAIGSVWLIFSASTT